MASPLSVPTGRRKGDGEKESEEGHKLKSPSWTLFPIVFIPFEEEGDT